MRPEHIVRFQVVLAVKPWNLFEAVSTEYVYVQYNVVQIHSSLSEIF